MYVNYTWTCLSDGAEIGIEDHIHDTTNYSRFDFTYKSPIKIFKFIEDKDMIELP